MANYYYRSGKGIEAGPFDLSEMERLIGSGKVLPEYMARNGDADWRLAAHFPELDFAPPTVAAEGQGMAIVLCILVPLVTAIFGLFYLGSEKTKKRGFFYLRWSAIAVLIWWAVLIALR